MTLTCDAPAEMDVSPSGYEPVEMICTIENTATVGATKIEIISKEDMTKNIFTSFKRFFKILICRIISCKTSYLIG